MSKWNKSVCLVKLIIVSLFSLISCECTNAQNIGLKKSYVLSAPPNYSLSALSSDTSSLTDGIYTSGYFWTQRTTLGWRNFDKITIDIDLKKQQPVKKITFNTARRIQASVSFPDNVYVFLSSDNQHFIYVGDAAASTENRPGNYEVTRFELNNINQSARYVLLTVIPKGLFVFCDEIEVIKGKEITKSSFQSRLILKDSLNNAIDSLKAIEFDRNHLIKMNDRRQYQTLNKSDVNLRNIDEKLKDHTTAQERLPELKKRIVRMHASELYKKYNTAFIVEKYNPWDTLSTLHYPKENVDLLRYNFLVPVNGVQYGAFVITNNQAYPQTFVINISDSDSKEDIKIFEATFVVASDSDKVPDALIPLNENTIIESGNSGLFIFKITGTKGGRINSTINIRSARRIIHAKISGIILDLFSSNEHKLNAINWAYLHYPMLVNRKSEVIMDLEQHHINTIVIPPAVIPRMGNNYQPFVNYIESFRNIQYILLFTNYSDIKNYRQFGVWMSPEFKSNFITWYHKLMNILLALGFTNSQIYLYPYDEVHGEDIAKFKEFARWVKTIVPEIKIYATLANKNAIDNIMPLTDIAQIISNMEFSPTLPNHEIWIYSTESSARLLSPYLYYRIMAWKAFLNNISGVGFWNYADEGMGKQLNLPSDSWVNPSNSYSVIYDGPGKEIFSSRRWEAFRLGIEDYSILQAYSKKYGVGNTKKLVKQVVDNPQDLNLADNVRNKMILALF